MTHVASESSAESWDHRLERWRNELRLLAELDEVHWVPLAVAEAETGVSRSALRSWYRNREIPSQLIDGPNGPQRLVPLRAVVERAARSPRLQRRAEREISLEAQVALLRHHADQLEVRLAALEHQQLEPQAIKHPPRSDPRTAARRARH